MDLDNESIEPDVQPEPEYGKQRRPRFSGRGWEWAILGLICLITIGYWSLHHHQFYVPHADYPSFERLSREIWRGEMPSDYKRMPLFPALMGGVARLIEHERPELEAALLLNFAFSLGILIMLYLFLRKIIGSVALVGVGMLCVVQLFHEMALLPLVEPMMGFLILLTLVLFQKGSRWQYAAAFFAALARMEAAALIFVIFILNAFSLDWKFSLSSARARLAAIFRLRWEKRRFWMNLIFAALASAGFITWFAMSFFLDSSDEFYTSMMEYTDLAFSFIVRATTEVFHGWIAVISPRIPWIIAFGFIVVLPCLVGLIISFKERMRGSFAALGFAVIHICAIIALGMSHTRFAYPILWVPMMYFLIGWSWILPATMGWFAAPERRGKFRLVFTIIMGLLAVVAAVYSMMEVYGVDGVAWQGVYPIYLGLLALIVGLYGWFKYPDSRTAAVSLGCLLAIMMLTIGAGAISAHAEKSMSRKYRNYSHHVSGMWLRDNLRKGEVAVLLRPRLAFESIEEPQGELIPFGSFKAQNMEELLPELEERNVKYVLYNFRDVPDKDERTHWWHYYHSFRVDLCMLFEGVQDIPGFEHVTTLELGDYLKYYDEPKPQVYRFIGVQE